ncbi:MAG: hypothetical protein JWM93_406 [Frankiales bacterium]|nr:hypothetical protein [Frankiales bacterium]
MGGKALFTHLSLQGLGHSDEDPEVTIDAVAPDLHAPDLHAPSLYARRGLIGLAAVIGAGVAQAAAADDAEAATVDPVLHLVRRATYGATPSLLSSVRSTGTRAWLDAQLRPSTVSDTAMNSLVARWPRLRWTIDQCRDNLGNGSWDVMFDLVDVSIARAAWSRRQLFETMVGFWSNHLNITCPSADVWDNRHLFDRDVIRKYALGKYSDMLVASARHPAMLRYLNNADSTKDSPNENYGRELLELHSVGVDGGYTERDMRSATLLLTGLSVNWRNGHYIYNAEDHHVGALKIMSYSSTNSTAAGGEAAALAYVKWLAHHPSTAKRIAHKLCVRFVADNPPAALVSRLAATYLRSDTAITPVLRQLFLSAEFAASAGKKTRTPYEDFIGSLRALGVQPDATGTEGVRALQWISSDIGQPPFGWPLPNGYPDVASAWASSATTLAKWNTHLTFASSGWPKPLRRPTPRSYFGAALPTTYGAAIDVLRAKLCLPAITSGQRSAICAFLGHRPGDALKPTDALFGWRLPSVLALLLDTPNYSIR